MKYEILEKFDFEIVANNNSGQIEEIMINGHGIMDQLVSPDEFINIIFGGRQRFWNRVKLAEFEYNSKEDALAKYKEHRDLMLERGDD